MVPPNLVERRCSEYCFPTADSLSTGLQGGPHNHTITALATALKQAKAPEYIAYQKQAREMICCPSTVAFVLSNYGSRFLDGVVPGMGS